MIGSQQVTHTNNELSSEQRSSEDSEGPIKVFVGRIPGPCLEQDLIEHFSQYTDVLAVSMNKRQNGKCLGYGHIFVKDRQEAERIIAIEHHLKGRQLFLDISVDKEQIRIQSNNVKERIIVASRVPSTFSEATLKEYFSQFGEIESVFLIPGNEFNRKIQTARVIFSSKDSVEPATKSQQQSIKSAIVTVRALVSEKRRNAQMAKQEVDIRTPSNFESNRESFNSKATNSEP